MRGLNAGGVMLRVVAALHDCLPALCCHQIGATKRIPAVELGLCSRLFALRIALASVSVFQVRSMCLMATPALARPRLERRYRHTSANLAAAQMNGNVSQISLGSIDCFCQTVPHKSPYFVYFGVLGVRFRQVGVMMGVSVGLMSFRILG